MRALRTKGSQEDKTSSELSRFILIILIMLTPRLCIGKPAWVPWQEKFWLCMHACVQNQSPVVACAHALFGDIA